MGLSVQQNVQLKGANYLRFEAIAETLARLESLEGAKELCALIKRVGQFRILGEGSNVLLGAERFPLIVQATMKGIEYRSQGSDVYVKVAAGENWAKLVDETAARGLYGIESLALIPGSMGAAPVQNIGAYGQEVGDVITEVEVVDLVTCETRIYSKDECEFAYRSSVFKKPDHKNELIVSVTMKLSTLSPVRDHGTAETATEVAERVKQTRRSKLPDPDQFPNVGSFFHNPIISETEALRLKQMGDQVPVYPHGTLFKVSAAWLIEQSGWKGYRDGDVGVSSKHALVFVNYTSPTAKPLLALAKRVIDDVKVKFGIELKIEPAVY